MKLDAKTFEKFLREKRFVKLKFAYWMTMEEMSATYGWTPEQIRNMKVRDFEIYKAILKGKREAEARMIEKERIWQSYRSK